MRLLLLLNLSLSLSHTQATLEYKYSKSFISFKEMIKFLTLIYQKFISFWNFSKLVINFNYTSYFSDFKKLIKNEIKFQTVKRYWKKFLMKTLG